jgi:uncharacterized repeat protein (TIGR03833 family)
MSMATHHAPSGSLASKFAFYVALTSAVFGSKKRICPVYCQLVERLFYGLNLHHLVPDGRRRDDIKIGSRVRIVEKKNQPTGKLTDGTVRRILTSSNNHPHGIKVQLESGSVGRVKEIVR